jgi:uncharacterized membrane protein YphA (DoxX/SURF4 family)
MSTNIVTKSISIVLRIFLGCFFIYTGIIKIIEPLEFFVVIENYQLVPTYLANFIAIVLPWLEFYCGLFLLLGIFMRTSTLFITTLMVVFTLTILSAIMRGLDIECGCYGGESPVGWTKIGENFILILMSLYLIYKPANFFTLMRN